MNEILMKYLNEIKTNVSLYIKSLNRFQFVQAT